LVFELLGIKVLLSASAMAETTSQAFISGFGNLSLVAGQKQTLQDMTVRTNFPTAIPFPLLFMMLLKLGNLWNYRNQINSWFSQSIKKTQNMTYSTFIAQCGFL